MSSILTSKVLFLGFFPCHRLRKKFVTFLIIIAKPIVLSKMFLILMGGSPGLVVMGVDSRSKGRGFESRRRILDGHDIFHIHLL